jgi:hypothetical protein
MPPCTITLRCVHNNLQGVILQDTESSGNTNMKTSNITTLNFHLNYSLNFPLSSKWHCQHTMLYTVMQKQRSVFWELTVLAIIRRKIHMNMCLIVNGHRDRAVWMYRPNCVRFWFMGLDEEQSLQTNGGYMRRTVCCNFVSAACIQQHEDRLKTKNTHSLHTTCEVQWRWWWTVWTFIVNCN